MDSVTDGLGNYYIYTGIWVNTRYNHVYGTTITLGRRDSALLIAFLALYVGLAGQGTWRITRFLLHHALSSTDSPDGVYNQRQAILRNTESGHSAALELLRMFWAWRKKKTRKIWARVLPVMGFSLLLSSAFATAGRFKCLSPN
jgi:hypothetical protein